MPPPERERTSRQTELPKPAAQPPPLKVVSAPSGLPPHRSESIAALTAKARTLHAESAENTAKIDVLQHRNSLIGRELVEINKQIIEHAWDGQPLT